ncbi:hypothetical protein ACLMJK_002815 [Lecanora helva]
MSALAISLLPAVTVDVPAIAEINRAAYFPEAIGRFVFTDWPEPTTQYQFFLSRVENRFKNPDSDLIKAVNTSSGEIVAFGALTYTPAGKSENKDERFAKPPPHMNIEIIKEIAAGARKQEEKVKGLTRYELSSMMVLPQYQGKGIGNQILDSFLAKADKAGLPIYLTAFPGVHDLYLKRGFRDVGHTDTDLRKWAGQYTGFGVYRNYFMLRSAQKSINENITFHTFE